MKHWPALLLALSAPALADGQCDQPLESFFRDLSTAAQQGDRERYVSLFTPGASMFVPHSPPLVGREAIGAWFDDFRETAVLVVDTYQRESIDVSGSVALIRSRGIGHYLVKATSEQIPFDQKYLDVLQCEGGDWRIAFHVASSATLDPGLWDRDWRTASGDPGRDGSATPSAPARERN